MFTGLVSGVGRVASTRRRGAGVRLVLEGGASLRGVRPGESVAVSGVCLTAVGTGPRTGRTAFEAVAETLRRTTLGDLRPGDLVNVERALRWGERLGGHVVTGHVDGTGTVRRVRDIGRDASRRRPGGAATGADRWPAGGRELLIAVPAEMAGRLVDRGSAAVDGVSLTVAGRGAGRFRVCLIPETLRRTTLGRLAPGDRVNVERDHGAEAWAAHGEAPSGITWSLLRRCGYLSR